MLPLPVCSKNICSALNNNITSLPQKNGWMKNAGWQQTRLAGKKPSSQNLQSHEWDYRTAAETDHESWKPSIHREIVRKFVTFSFFCHKHGNWGWKKKIQPSPTWKKCVKWDCQNSKPLKKKQILWGFLLDLDDVDPLGDLQQFWHLKVTHVVIHPWKLAWNLKIISIE